jgi:GTP-binding protein EngB required for normal cell division
MGQVLAVLPPAVVATLVHAVVTTAADLFRELFINRPVVQVQHRPPGLSDRDVVEQAQARVGMDCVAHYNFAVCGPSGVGKSYFINSARGIRPGAAGAADVGITETTHETFRYDFPTVPHLKLWDLPGFGTERHPTRTYVRDKSLFAFDAVLVLYSDRLLAGVVDIVREMDAAGVPVALVRTKADRAVEDVMADKGMTLEEARRHVRQDVEREMWRELGARAGTMRSFLVSMRDHLVRGELAYDEAALIAFMGEAVRPREAAR